MSPRARGAHASSRRCCMRFAHGPETIKLGDLEVRRLGYGAMRLPGKDVWGEPEDPATAHAVLRRAIELGINFIDTAWYYGPHVANRLIVEALHPYPSDLVIATKLGGKRLPDKSWVAGADARGAARRRRDRSRDAQARAAAGRAPALDRAARRLVRRGARRADRRSRAAARSVTSRCRNVTRRAARAGARDGRRSSRCRTCST